MNWHLGKGSLPTSEQGFDLSVRTKRVGDQMFAIARVGTPWGPVELMARADMKTVSGILGASGASLQRIAARLATEGVMKKVAEATSATKSAAAERLYVRLKKKEPQAWESAHTLIAMADLGDPKAQQGLACLKAVHAKHLAVSTSGTLDSPLRGAEYHPFDDLVKDMSGFMPHLPSPFPHAEDHYNIMASGFSSRLPPPFFRSTNVIAGCDSHAAGTMVEGDNTQGWRPYRPIPYWRPPTVFPRLPMGPYRGYAAGIQQRQEASYISGAAAGRGLQAQGLSVLLALGRR